MKLERIYCKHFPLKGHTAMTVFPFVFIREDRRQKYTPTVNRHEMTHGFQQIETFMLGAVISVALCWYGAEWWSLLGLLLYYELYLLEWLIKLPFCGWDVNKAYKSVSFEQEAYAHQGRVDYNLIREDYAWIEYIFKIK